MRRLSVAAVLAVWLLPPLPARAGLYNGDEPQVPLVFSDFRQFREGLLTVQSAVSPDSTAGRDVRKRVEELEKVLSQGALTYQQRINLSAYYVRLTEYEKAVVLLESLPRQERDFLAWSNLATASQLAGRLERAEGYLMEALAAWPKVSPWCDSQQLNWLHLVEKYYLQLIRLRLREARMATSGPQSVDALFPRVRFIGPSGTYEAGILAADQWANLPAESLAIVKQLVLWMPHDSRLQWLLAELVNAAGDKKSALQLMDDLKFGKSYGNAEFNSHFEVLRHAKIVAEVMYGNTARFLQAKADASLAPLGDLLTPSLGAVLDAVGTAVALDKVEPPARADVFTASSAPTESPVTTSAPLAGWTPEWRQIAVSFVAGVIVAALLSLQLREMRKRKSDAQPASRE